MRCIASLLLASGGGIALGATASGDILTRAELEERFAVMRDQSAAQKLLAERVPGLQSQAGASLSTARTTG